MSKYLIGIQLLVVGMGTVLLTLYLLSLFIRLTGRFFGPKERDVKPVITENKGMDKDINFKNKETGLDQTKVAAITAALYQTLDQREYRIISIKRQENSNWK